MNHRNRRVSPEDMVEYGVIVILLAIVMIAVILLARSGRNNVPSADVGVYEAGTPGY